MEESVPFLEGTLTMVNSVLDVMPAYMMSVFPALDNVIKRIDMLRRNFFWQGSEDEKISFGQKGRGYKKQEERGSRDQNYKDAKQKPNDDVTMSHEKTCCERRPSVQSMR